MRPTAWPELVLDESLVRMAPHRLTWPVRVLWDRDNAETIWADMTRMATNAILDRAVLGNTRWTR